jgi:hypothetical protein
MYVFQKDFEAVGLSWEDYVVQDQEFVFTRKLSSTGFGE